MFENFRDKCIEIFELDSVYFLSALGIAWQTCLKDRSGIRINNRLWYVILVEKGISGGICQATYKYAKANKKYMNNYDKNIESSYIAFLDASNSYGWAMSQKLPLNGFEWVEKEELSKFNKTL